MVVLGQFKSTKISHKEIVPIEKEKIRMDEKFETFLKNQESLNLEYIRHLIINRIVTIQDIQQIINDFLNGEVKKEK